MKRRRPARLAAFLLAATLLHAAGARAFESDVHYGLTYWLALQAGFAPPHAEAIALGNSRVDSGDMQFVDPMFDYACLTPDPDGTRQAARNHYPTAGTIPGPPEQRAVVPGDKAAMQQVDEVMKAPLSFAGFMLFKLGYALHALQDSWSHQGTSDVPQIPDRLFACDPTLAWAHPHARGGFNSHRADHTASWPADTIAMARATYEVLIAYPPIREARSPRDWSQVRPLLDGFVKATTKSEKRAWFIAQNIVNVEFLAETSLKDGSASFALEWSGRKLPRLQGTQSRQHHVDAEVLDFYSRFFSDWMAGSDLDALAAAHAAPASPRANGAFEPMDARELAARLKLWRMRDHGAAAELAHAPRRLAARQIAAVDALVRAPDALAGYGSSTEALLPLVARGKDASPLLPFIVANAPASDRGQRRVVATAKLRHAPNDIVSVVAELIDGRWRVVWIVAAVDH